MLSLNVNKGVLMVGYPYSSHCMAFGIEIKLLWIGLESELVRANHDFMFK